MIGVFVVEDVLESAFLGKGWGKVGKVLVWVVEAVRKGVGARL